VRLAVARDEGLDEATVADADGPGATLTDRQRAALALADAEMSQPSGLSPDQVRELHAHFRPDELVELTLDVMKWNYQKVAVALGIDDEVRPGALSDLAFDADGHAIL
jgi:alkylhydroperoxidase family enzyme